MDPSTSWAVGDRHGATVTDDALQQFLNNMNMDAAMGNLADGMNYDFQDFPTTVATAPMLSAHAPEPLDLTMSGTDAAQAAAAAAAVLVSPAMGPVQSIATTAPPFGSIPASMMPPPTPSGAVVDSIDAQIQFLQQEKLRHQQRQLEQQQQAAALFARQQAGIIPPTPQSFEMQPGASQFLGQSNATEQHHHHHHHHHHQQRQSVSFQSLTDQSDVRRPLDNVHHYHHRGSEHLTDRLQVSFTPLVSPAVTPLDANFSIESQFNVTGTMCFSPLTSPALHAQNDCLNVFDQRQTMNDSPIEMDLDSTMAAAQNQPPGDLAKKMRKNAAKARAKSGAAGIKQSPISKHVRRKTATTPSLSAQALSEIAEGVENSNNQDNQQLLLPTPMMPTASSSSSTASVGGITDSENGSTSPEAMPDSVTSEMPPPPLPRSRSAKPSPFLAPQGGAGGVLGSLQPRQGVASPATPASLMKLNSPGTRSSGVKAGSHGAVDNDHIEAFSLPESASFGHSTIVPTPSTSQPVESTSTQPTPKQPPKDSGPFSKTPALVPLPSPSLRIPPTAVSSATPSPQIPAMNSGLDSRKTTPQIVPRNSKKRPSVSSIPAGATISPALRPKISPNIKPLIPGGGQDVIDEEEASRILASKSNYQRILEGNHLPGVSYPSELSANLTQKRTSHKLAEQGRRNRINSALQEIASLLPKKTFLQQQLKESSEGEGGGNNSSEGGQGQGQQRKNSGGVPISKASTVEMAIEYIKQLQREVAEATKRAEEAERRLREREEKERAGCKESKESGKGESNNKDGDVKTDEDSK